MKNNNKQLTEFTVNVRVKLAGLWTTLMLLYIFVFAVRWPKEEITENV